MWETRQIAGAGIGCVALRAIGKGERVLHEAPLLQSPLRLQLRSDTHREAIVGTINSMPAIAINRAPFNFTILGLLWSQKLGFFHAGRYIDPDVQPWWKHVIIQHRLPRQRWLE